MEFKFSCPNCGQHIATTEEFVGAHVSCPGCSRPITIPMPGIPLAPAGRKRGIKLLGLMVAIGLVLGGAAGFYLGRAWPDVIPWRKPATPALPPAAYIGNVYVDKDNEDGLKIRVVLHDD